MKLTEEDWNSEEARSIAGSLWRSLWIGMWLLLWLLLVILWLWLMHGVRMWLGVVPWLVSVLVMGLWMGVGMGKTKPFLFPGAYLHYRKRVKNPNGGRLQ